jgi:hypothetical protein
LVGLACVIAIAIMWPPRCSTSPTARIGNSILIAGCPQR